MPYAKLLSPCNCFLQHRLNGLQTNLPKINKNSSIITCILTCFDESMAKTQPYQGIVSPKGP